MKKAGVAITAVVLLSSIALFTFSQLPKQAQINQEINTPSPTAVLIPTPTPIPSPAPTVASNSDPAAEGSFGPIGCFRIASPIHGTCYPRNLTLTVVGSAISKPMPLSMSYSIDGQQKTFFYVVVRQAHDWDPFFGVINETVPLPPLNSGPHSITVFGSFGGVFAQANVHFTVR